MSFLSATFGGSNSTLNSNIGNFGAAGGSLLKSGQNSLGDATSFFHGILNGDFSSLAPQISSMQKQGGQKLNSLFQFGNRGGGTNAVAASTGDQTRAGINDLEAGAKTSAASNLASIGTSSISAGSSLLNMQDQASQQQMENWKSSILGQGISSAAGFAESFGLGAGANAVNPSLFKTMF